MTDTKAIYTRVPDGIAPMPHMDPAFNDSRKAGHDWFDNEGWDVYGRIEIPVAWGQQDIFNHVNNVHYARFVESSRMRWLATLAPDLGQKAADDLVNGTGIGIILKDQMVRFRAPVTYPDSIIWAAKAHNIDQKNGRFVLSHAGWSVKDKKVVVTADSTIVIYDYNKMAKGKLTDEMRDVFLARGQGIKGVKAKL